MTQGRPEGARAVCAILMCLEQSRSECRAVSLCCPRCEGALTLHQPDPDLPGRLLATCFECKTWYLTNSVRSVFTPLTEVVDHDSCE